MNLWFWFHLKDSHFKLKPKFWMYYMLSLFITETVDHKCTWLRTHTPTHTQKQTLNHWGSLWTTVYLRCHAFNAPVLYSCSFETTEMWGWKIFGNDSDIHLFRISCRHECWLSLIESHEAISANHFPVQFVMLRIWLSEHCCFPLFHSGETQFVQTCNVQSWGFMWTSCCFVIVIILCRSAEQVFQINLLLQESCP